MGSNTTAGRSAGKREPARPLRVKDAIHADAPAAPAPVQASAPGAPGRRKAGAAPMLEEIAFLAHELETLLGSIIDSNTAEHVPAAAGLCRQIGWIADRTSLALGGNVFRGGVEDWLLSPVASEALARIEKTAVAGGAA